MKFRNSPKLKLWAKCTWYPQRLCGFDLKDEQTFQTDLVTVWLGPKARGTARESSVDHPGRATEQESKENR